VVFQINEVLFGGWLSVSLCGSQARKPVGRAGVLHAELGLARRLIWLRSLRAGNAIDFWPRSAGQFWPTPRPSTYGQPDQIGVPFVDWKAKVDLFEQLRREHEFGIGTIAGVAAKFGVHRRVVRRGIAGALPPVQHYPERTKPKLGAVAAFIDQVLDEDRRAPRKQRQTVSIFLPRFSWSLERFSEGLAGQDVGQGALRCLPRSPSRPPPFLRA
jgi:hypothetical protein